ncbi:MAG: ABC transporter substrate-binding protein [Acidimicrobiales bacterium]
MTNPGVWEGLTKKTGSGNNALAAFYTYYHKVWAKQIPNIHVNELPVPSGAIEETKTILGVQTGSPPDLVAFHGSLPAMVQRGALMNLTPYFKSAGLKASDFLPALAQYSRYHGQWYAMPGASSPTTHDVLYVPKFVQAAGINPTQIPRTWSGLWKATKKVTTWGPGHTLQRIGESVVLGNKGNEGMSRFGPLSALYCGSNTALWNPSTGFHLNAPCVLNFVRYERKLVNFYGGWAKYQTFIAGDPGPWSCSKSDYSANGKILFNITGAYWNGLQMDHCYNEQWALSWAPTMNGTAAQAKSVQATQWFVAIPKGAKHPRAAFQFWLDTLYKNGQLSGPTTNGYIRPSQANIWWQDIVKLEGQLRAKNGFSGNPISTVVPMEKQEAAAASWSWPKSTINNYVTTAEGNAWNKVVYNHVAVKTAFDAAQAQVAHQEHVTPGGVYVK